MRISDWSSDVCSSDLFYLGARCNSAGAAGTTGHVAECGTAFWISYRTCGGRSDREGSPDIMNHGFCFYMASRHGRPAWLGHRADKYFFCQELVGPAMNRGRLERMRVM